MSVKKIVGLGQHGNKGFIPQTDRMAAHAGHETVANHQNVPESSQYAMQADQEEPDKSQNYVTNGRSNTASKMATESYYQLIQPQASTAAVPQNVSSNLNVGGVNTVEAYHTTPSDKDNDVEKYIYPGRICDYRLYVELNADANQSQNNINISPSEPPPPGGALSPPKPPPCGPANRFKVSIDGHSIRVQLRSYMVHAWDVCLPRGKVSLNAVKEFLENHPDIQRDWVCDGPFQGYYINEKGADQLYEHFELSSNLCRDLFREIGDRYGWSVVEDRVIGV
ncbi:hypothetical protein CI238_12978 [Colletotrichum incanum]|uniref:Uncharacterized protein n=1 Tax=Colletotrichum incanum TaxID=1573173 RepID=A0A167DIG8_COLIC|nr:hypothetical protein CI238_12978 [Colletotrichum incanum]